MLMLFLEWLSQGLISQSYLQKWTVKVYKIDQNNYVRTLEIDQKLNQIEKHLFKKKLLLKIF